MSDHCDWTAGLDDDIEWADISTTAATGPTTAFTMADILDARDKMLAIPKPVDQCDVIVMTTATLRRFSNHPDVVCRHDALIDPSRNTLLGVPFFTRETHEQAVDLAMHLMIDDKRSVMLVSE